MSLLWLNDKDQTVNQVAACQDAYYRLERPSAKGIQTLQQIMANAGKEPR